MTSRTSLHIMAAVVIPAASLVYALGGSAQSAQQAPTQAEQQAIAQVAAFQRSAGAEDQVPGETMLSGIVRRIGPSDTQKPVWASIDPTQDCVQVGEEGASACAAPERLEHEPLIVGAARAGTFHLSEGAPPPAPEEWAGLAVDDVESIEVTYQDGETSTVPVTNNGFYLDPEGRSVKAFAWTTSNGTVHTYPQEG